MIDALLTDWRALSAIVGLALFFVWESLAPFFAQQERGRHAARNLTIASANVVLVGACCAGATVAVAEMTAVMGLGVLSQVRLPTAARVMLGFLLLDLWTYWWHRANHRWPLLWRFHRMHHSDPSLDVTSAVRFHSGELLLSAGLRLLLIPLFGLPLAALVLYDGVVVATTQFHHANIGLGDRADTFVRFVVVSPNMHKLHHSQLRIETDSNYATVLSCWDRLFGTYRRRENYHEIEFGLPDLEAERFQTIKGLILTPFRRI
ncbi:MAG: sterol desaturase family protein [Acidobacteria bacterium]|nr:sterol desaturase family protein [Acidobacteriota bacterium]